MKRPFRIVSILGLLLFCGCSSFNRDWSRAASQSLNDGTVAGAWEGTWMSDSNHHHGPLRCILSREDDSHYEARFRAGYLGFLRFSYTAHLEFQPHDFGWEFDGEANLGKLGGEYYYEGRATTTNMASIYRSKYDHGTFELERKP